MLGNGIFQNHNMLFIFYVKRPVIYITHIQLSIQLNKPEVSCNVKITVFSLNEYDSRYRYTVGTNLGEKCNFLECLTDCFG